jgi:hypothetical protein
MSRLSCLSRPVALASARASRSSETAAINSFELRNDGRIYVFLRSLIASLRVERRGLEAPACDRVSWGDL